MPGRVGHRRLVPPAARDLGPTPPKGGRRTPDEGQG